MATNTVEQAKKRCIKVRNEIGSTLGVRRYMARVRMSRAVSKELASIQGLCYAFGERECLAELFEKVCMPALRVYVRKYASKAYATRKEGAHEGC